MLSCNIECKYYSWRNRICHGTANNCCHLSFVAAKLQYAATVGCLMVLFICSAREQYNR